MINLDDMTLGQLKEIQQLVGGSNTTQQTSLNGIVGKKCIIRTYSAGVWFGKVIQKTATEVVVQDARRLYYWKTNGGISLSEVSLAGVHKDSKIPSPVKEVYLQQIELIPCTEVAINSIESQPNYNV